MSDLWLRSVVFAFASVVLVACSAESNESQRVARDIWTKHEAIALHAVYGEEAYDIDEFMESVDFLVDLTGIEIRVEMYTYGYMPIAETEEDLERVREWYEENSDRLYYDAETESVLLSER